MGIGRGGRRGLQAATSNTTRRLAVLATLVAVGGGSLALIPHREPVPWEPSAQVRQRISSAEDAARQRPTAALFVGDSYTAGGGEVKASGTFASLTCDRMGWTCYKDAQGGTGYTTDGKVNDPTFTPYLARLGHTRASLRPDVVVVSGGRNDIGAAGERAATRRYMAAVHTAFPKARLVVLSPFWNDDRPPPVLVEVREAVRAAAARQRADWVDTTGWLSPRLMGRDGVHPTAEGHYALAARLVTVLRQRGY